MFDLGKAIMDAVGMVMENMNQANQKKETQTKPAPKAEEKTSDFNTKANFTPELKFGRVWRLNRSLLSPQDQSLYDAINEATSRCIPSVRIQCEGTPDVKHLMNVTLALIEDDPSLFYVDSGITVKSNGHVADIEFKYNRFMNNKDGYLERMKDVTAQIYEKIVKNCPDAYSAELAIHDYFTKSMVYDGSDDVASHSMAGPLLTGKGVCEGISEAYCYVANACGLKTSMMSGELEGVGHRWNIIEIAGKRYHLDVTSDLGGLHAFFNCDDARMRQTHVFNKKCNCVSMDRNYYSVSNSRFSDMKGAEVFIRQNAASVPSSFEFMVESCPDPQSIGKAVQGGLRKSARISITSKNGCYKVDLK